MIDIRPLSAHTGDGIHGVDMGQSLPDKTILEIRLAHLILGFLGVGLY